MTSNQLAKLRDCIQGDPELWHLNRDMIEVLAYLYGRKADTHWVPDIGYDVGLEDAILWPTLCMLSYYQLIVPFHEGTVVARRVGISVKGIKTIEKFSEEMLSVEG